MQVIQISTETVGQAFLQALAAQYAAKSKSKRRAEFNRLKRTLLAMRLIPSTFDVHAIAWGISRVGGSTIVVTGEPGE